MFCMKCGAKLPDEAAFCFECGAKTTQTDSSIESPTNSNITESIIMKGLCNQVKSAFNVQNGNAILTNKRLIYLKHSLAKTLAIGAFINLTEGSYEFDIPISEITNISDGRQGISKTIIINTISGEKYNFYFTNREEWKIALLNALSQKG